MRKLGALTAVVALVGAVSADAANVTFGIRQTGTNLTTISVTNGQVVAFQVTATIDDGTTSTDGLALVGTDLTFGGATIAQLNGGALANPGGLMTAFNYPNGVTNPPFPPGSYGGTNNGTALLQVGGGQNTIGNPGPNPPFPVGAVNLQVGTAGVQVIATGNYTVPASGSGPFTITLANCFANSIDNGETGPVFNVSAATATCGAVLTMTVSGTPGNLSTAVARKNCDLNIDMPAGAPITTDSRQGAPAGRGISRVVFNYTGGAPANNTIVINQDASCPSPPTYVAYTGTSVPTCVIGASTLDCTFTPNLENARTYRFTVASGLGTANVELRGLVGDTNSDGNVNATDRSVVVAAWTGGGFTCATDLNGDAATNATDRSIVVSAWTGGPATNCAP